MYEATAHISEKREEKIPFTVSEEMTANGSRYKLITSQDYTIALYPAESLRDSPEKKTRLLHNAVITMQTSLGPMVFSTAVREFKDSGDIIAGQSGRRTGTRALATEYNRETGRSYERAAIPENEYYRIMSIIKAVHAEAGTIMIPEAGRDAA